MKFVEIKKDAGMVRLLILRKLSVALLLAGGAICQPVLGMNLLSKPMDTFLQKKGDIKTSSKEIISLKDNLTESFLKNEYLIFKNLIRGIAKLSSNEKKELYKDVCGCVKGDDTIDLTPQTIVFDSQQLAGLSEAAREIFLNGDKKQKWYLHLFKKELQDGDFSPEEQAAVTSEFLEILSKKSADDKNDKKKDDKKTEILIDNKIVIKDPQATPVNVPQIDDAVVKAYLVDLKRLKKIHLPLVALLWLCKDTFPESVNTQYRPFIHFSKQFAWRYIMRRYNAFLESMPPEKQRKFYENERPVLSIKKMLVGGVDGNFRIQILEFCPELVFTKIEQHKYILDKEALYQTFFRSLWTINGIKPDPKNERAAMRLIKKLSATQLEKLLSRALHKDEPVGFFDLIKNLMTPQQKRFVMRVPLSGTDTLKYFFLESAPSLSMLMSILAGSLFTKDEDSFFANSAGCATLGLMAYVLQKENEWNQYFGRDEKYKKSSLLLNGACFGVGFLGSYIKTKLSKNRQNSLAPEVSHQGILSINHDLVSAMQKQK